ncbi:hypothetical protein JM47_01275 [Ureaplasma diversum]|uniref:Uncharacterized protein n=1 Tax=Ureaplasma diversum TaxID=42094 RepID=A0A0C5S1J0_9BACT|nr:hypothetical protein [Ureaplasma diversum]AJQ45250.1 hypothetical protein JM47_01275 [Ureaplasma diversum]
MNKTKTTIHLETEQLLEQGWTGNPENVLIRRTDGLLFEQDHPHVCPNGGNVHTSGVLYNNYDAENISYYDLDYGFQDDSIVILNNDIDPAKVKDYADKLETLVDQYYETISKNFMDNNIKENAVEIVQDNENWLNSFINEGERICYNLFADWYFKDIKDLIINKDQQTAKEHQVYSQKANKLKNGEDLKKLNKEHQDNLEKIERDYFDSVYSRINEIKQKILKDDSLFNSSSSKENFIKLTLALSTQIGVISELEEILEVQEQNRVYHMLQIVKINRLKLNNYYGNENQYLAALYEKRINFLSALGLEISVLKFLVDWYTLFIDLKTKLTTKNHPLANYATYYEAIKRIKASVRWAAKNKKALDFDDEFDNLYDLIDAGVADSNLSDYEFLQKINASKNEVVTHKAYKTVYQPNYSVNATVNNSNIDLKAYINNQKVPLKTTLNNK